MAAPSAQNHAAIAHGATVAVEPMSEPMLDLETTYTFANQDNGQRYKVLPKNIIRTEEGQSDRMCLRASDGHLAKFIFAGDKQGHHSGYSLVSHKGFMQLLVLRNTAHAASANSSSNVGGAGSASTSAIASIFKRASTAVSPETAFRRGRQAPLVSTAEKTDLVEIELSPESRIHVGRPKKASDPLVVPISKANMMAIVAFVLGSHGAEESFQRQVKYDLAGKYKGGYQLKGFGGPRSVRRRGKARGSYKERWDGHSTPAKRKRATHAVSSESGESSAGCAEDKDDDNEDDASERHDESDHEEDHGEDHHGNVGGEDHEEDHGEDHEEDHVGEPA